MSAPDTIKRLVDHFDQNRSSFLSPHYREAQLRKDFLDPFIIALGWDLNNDSGYSEAYRDVVVESAVEVEGAAKAPDYSFRVGGNRKFFVEAKKPSVNIEFDIHPAFQVRRYAWSAKLPLSILTDFEEFAVYDCRTRPDKSDKAATGRVNLLNYKEYLTRWDEIADTFSKDAVLHGKFDQFAEAATGKRGTQEVDDAFLQEIEKWRDLLARNLALRNTKLTTPELNYAVQITIDRIIFLRICEDRQIENEDCLKDICSGENIYPELVSLFHKADTRYNSGLFHFNIEKTQSSTPDDLTPTLAIDDKVLKEIVDSLYYPSPYVFRVLPVDILGQVYERFLGKVIRLTAGHQAKVEEKPEVRKAGGVYYTPTYIVDYIVKNTVGKLLENKTPVQAASLKIVDPACGSGSFLLGAYQYLLDWHIKWYSDNQPEKWCKGRSPAIYQAQGGWRLTTAEKKNILLNNIHGVDIDPQAVEVTKLSLSLKVLEGESQETLNSQLSLFKDRALPDLGKNIQCGNSLIGEDYFEGRLMVDEEERWRVNPFEWNNAFTDVFKQNGFDAVIGNPPYLKIEHISEDERVYFGKKFKTFIKRYDTFGLFIEKSHRVMQKTGLFGMIIPSTMLNNQSFKELRKLLISEVAIRKIVNLGGKVFEGVNNDTLILIFENNKIENFKTPIFDVLDYGKGLNTAILTDEKDLTLASSIPGYIFELRMSNDADRVIKKIQTGRTLGEYCSCFQGFVTGNNNAYIFTKEQIHKEKIEKSLLKPAIFGDEIGRYTKPNSRTMVAYITNDMELEDFPYFKSYIEQFRSQLITKRETRLGRQPWFALHWPRVRSNFERSPKILVQAIRNLSLKRRVIATIDKQGLFADHTLFVISPHNNDYDIHFILGILNSTLVNYLFSKKFIDINIKGIYLSDIPFPIINLSNNRENQIYDQIISSVKRMVEIKSKTMHSTQEKESLQREIAATDKQIDNLVYQLYGLTPEEIKIVEGA
jgi:type I restriction-modification system DNA methylase subunit